MSINLSNSVKLLTFNLSKISRPIITTTNHYGPYIDAADGALLRDKKSDAIKALVSPIINRTSYNIAKCIHTVKIN